MNPAIWQARDFRQPTADVAALRIEAFRLQDRIEDIDEGNARGSALPCFEQRRTAPPALFGEACVERLVGGRRKMKQQVMRELAPTWILSDVFAEALNLFQRAALTGRPRFCETLVPTDLRQQG